MQCSHMLKQCPAFQGWHNAPGLRKYVLRSMVWNHVVAQVLHHPSFVFFVVLAMPRRNFEIDDEGRANWVFESGSEEDELVGEDEGVEDMLKRMRVGDEEEARFVLMSCHLVVVRPEDLRRWGRNRLRRWFDLWTSRLLLHPPMRERAARLRRWQHN